MSNRLPPLGREGPTRLLTGLSHQLAELDEAVQRQAQRFRAVVDIGTAIACAPDVDALLRLVIDRLTALLGADAASLFMLDEGRQELWSRVLVGPVLEEIRVPAHSGLVGHVLRTGESVVVHDAYADVRFNASVDQESGFRTRSLIAAPLRHVSGRILGVVEVLHRRVGAFTPEDRVLVEAMASHIAAVLDNVLLLGELREQNAELASAKRELSQALADLDVLYEVERAVSSTVDRAQLLWLVLTRATRAVGAQAAAALLVDDGAGTLHFRPPGVELERAEGLLSFPVHPEAGLVGQVAASGQPLRLEDAAGSPHVDPSLVRRLGLVVREVLCVPITGNDRVLGALELMNKEGGFSEGDARVATLIAGQVGRALLLREERAEGERRERLEAIGQTLSAVMHDLRGPLTVISGYTQLMAGEADAEERRRLARIIDKQFEHIGRMTRETLAFVRGESEVLLQKVFLHRFLEEVELVLRPQFEAAGVTLEVVADYRGAARVDDSQLKRAVFNLAHNALQAMPDGGRFTLGARREGDELVLRFRDTGPGIPPEIADRLFQAFVTSGKRDGTGLGLASVRRVAQAHGGRVSVESRPGEGTTFELHIPTALPESE